MRHWLCAGQSCGTWRIMYQAAMMALAASATTVVTALQTIPNPSPPISTMSSTALSTAENARNLSGVLESPTLFRPAASAL